MRRIYLSAFIALIICPNLFAKEYKLFYLGGQSNMEGQGLVKELPKELNKPIDGVMIFHGNSSPDGKPVDGKGSWSELRPGHGSRYSHDGKAAKYSNKFGLELSFAKRLKELYPNDNIAIIKYSKGGTSIHIEAAKHYGCWDPDYKAGKGQGKGINQYDHFLATVNNAYLDNDIDDDGEVDTLKPAGILWMQGESDTRDAYVAFEYQKNLKRLMDQMRAVFRVDDLPVIIGKISEPKRNAPADEPRRWTHGTIVMTAQQEYANNDDNAAIITSTDSYGYSDTSHYDSKGYIDLGIQFANEYAKLVKSNQCGTCENAQ